MIVRLGNPDLTEEQCQAVIQLLIGFRVVILTGGPGTGKTTTVRALQDAQIATPHAQQRNFQFRST